MGFLNRLKCQLYFSGCVRELSAGCSQRIGLDSLSTYIVSVRLHIVDGKFIQYEVKLSKKTNLSFRMMFNGLLSSEIAILSLN